MLFIEGLKLGLFLPKLKNILSIEDTRYFSVFFLFYSVIVGILYFNLNGI